MIERTVIVGSTSGLHARPAKLLVQAAATQPTTVRLRIGDRPPIDTRSILAVLAARVKQGTEVTLQAEGDGAEEAVTALAELIARNLDEEGGDA